jgi:hypothetical protein
MCDIFVRVFAILAGPVPIFNPGINDAISKPALIARFPNTYPPETVGSLISAIKLVPVDPIPVTAAIPVPTPGEKAAAVEITSAAIAPIRILSAVDRFVDFSKFNLLNLS